MATISLIKTHPYHKKNFDNKLFENICIDVSSSGLKVNLTNLIKVNKSLTSIYFRYKYRF